MIKKDTKQKYFGFSFTIIRPTEEIHNRLKKKVSSSKLLDFYVIGKESATTEHLQCYISFAKAKTWYYAKRFIHEQCHLEASKKSSIANWEYCIKEGNYFYGGSLKDAERKNKNLLLSSALDKQKRL